jgi:DNA-binding response OmpR family regulator
MTALPPRVLLIVPDQWPRALLRAALREAGYDALGAPALAAALRYRAEMPGRGSVRVVLIDQASLAGDEAEAQLEALVRRHATPALVLLTKASQEPSRLASVPGAWSRIVRRPASIADLVATVQQILPLPPESARPLD